jgi:TolB-like protein/Tfp pilus assembly protein PilF
MRVSPGTRLGPFEVVAPLGAGGMGEVYRARDTRLQRDVALKLLPEALAASPDRLARFEREARTVAGLAHPNIVILHSIEEHAAVKFLVLELVDGLDLTSIVTPAGLPVAQLIDIAIPLAEALVAAHKQGVVHRDLKPANVMLARDGRVKVLDFGLAKDSHPSVPTSMAATISEMGQVLGTVPYMAPEQIRCTAVDERTDLFAFGILVYELATGVRPFTGESAHDVTASILRDTPAPLTSVRPDLPEDLERIIDRCLAKDPRERYQTAVDVLDELKRIGKGPRAKRAESRIVSIAVLPFANRSANDDDEYFAEGLADELLSVLGRIRGLRVSARTATARFKGAAEDLQAIGRALNVETILEGSVRKAGSRVRITVQLAKVSDGYRIWSESYDRTLEDVFAVQDDIAQSVVKELRAALLGETPNSVASRDARAEVAEAVRGRTANPEVQRLVLEARYLVSKRTPEMLDKAEPLLARAMELDPAYGPAYVMQFRRLQWRNDFTHDPAIRAGEIRKMQALLDRAFALCPDDADVLAARAVFDCKYRLDWKRAFTSAQRAAELASGDASVLRSVQIVVSAGGQLAEAEALLHRILELDPLEHGSYLNLGFKAYWQGRTEEAIVLLRRAIDLGTVYAGHAWLALALAEQQNWTEAMAELEREKIEALALWARVGVLSRMGRIEQAGAVLDQLIERFGTEGGAQIAECCAMLGRYDDAFEWIDRAIAAGDTGIMDVLRNTPFFRPMNPDPRWSSLMRRLHFEE